MASVTVRCPATIAAPTATACSGSEPVVTDRPSSPPRAAAADPIRVERPTSSTLWRSAGARPALARVRATRSPVTRSSGSAPSSCGLASGEPRTVNLPARCRSTAASTLPTPSSTTATVAPSASVRPAAYSVAAASAVDTKPTRPSPRDAATAPNASSSAGPHVAGCVSTTPSGAPPSRSATTSTTRRSRTPSSAPAAKGEPSRRNGCGSVSRGRMPRATRAGSAAARATAASPTSGAPSAGHSRTDGIAALCSPRGTTPARGARCTAAVVMVAPRSTPSW